MTKCKKNNTLSSKKCAIVKFSTFFQGQCTITQKSPVHEYETEGWIPSRYALQDDFNDSVSEKTPGINQAWL